MISVLFLCLSIAKTIKRKKSSRSIQRERPSRLSKNDVSSISNGIVRERQGEDNNSVRILSEGIVNVSFDDIDDINMIDSGSIDTVNDDDGDKKESWDINANGVNSVSVGNGVMRSISFKDDLLFKLKRNKEESVSENQDKDKSSKTSSNHTHGPSLFTCSQECFKNNSIRLLEH